MFNRPSIKLLRPVIMLLGLVFFLLTGSNSTLGSTPAKSESQTLDAVHAEPSAEIKVTIVTTAPQVAGEPVVLVADIGDLSPIGLTFSWSFGDGQTALISNNNSVIHTYANPGAYGALVLVSNSDGSDTGQASAQVQIDEVPEEEPEPLTSVTIAGTGSAEVGSPVTFIASWEPATETNATFYWDFGDGTFEADAPSIVSHTYTRPGSYTVSVLAYNDSTNPPVANILPVEITPACITGLDIQVNSELYAGQSVDFIADIEKGSQVIYRWSFGDSGSGAANSAEGKNVSHTYVNPGRYTVSLEASNACSTEVDTQEVVVGEPRLKGLRIVSNSPRDVDEDALDFVAIVDSGDVDTYLWDMDDGTVITTTINHVSYAYNADGNYVVKVTASNEQNTISASTVATWKVWPIDNPGEPAGEGGVGVDIFAYIYIPDEENPIGMPISLDALVVGTPYIFSILPPAVINFVSHPVMVWDFGDGTKITEEQPVHTFNRIDDFGVTAMNESAMQQRYSAVVNTVRSAHFMPLNFDFGGPKSAALEIPTRMPTAEPTTETPETPVVTPTTPVPSEEPTAEPTTPVPTTPVPTTPVPTTPVPTTPVPTTPEPTTPVPTTPVPTTPVPTDTPVPTPTATSGGSSTLPEFPQP